MNPVCIRDGFEHVSQVDRYDNTMPEQEAAVTCSAYPKTTTCIVLLKALNGSIKQ